MERIITKSALANPRYRCDVDPFKAMDLLRNGPAPPHLYRHDLESFFYMLAYVCAVWDPEKRKFGHLSAWEQETSLKIERHKHEFLLDRNVFDRTFRKAHSSLKHLAVHEPEAGWICLRLNSASSRAWPRTS